MIPASLRHPRPASSMVYWLRIALLFVAILSANVFFVPSASADDKDQQPSTQSIHPIVQTVGNGPIVIAHGGASAYLPEHTPEATTLAHAMAADFIGLSVVLSKDEIPIVLHDITLNGSTNVAEVFADRAVAGKHFAFDFTLEELRQLNVTERHAKQGRFPKGQGRFRISTLAEHLQLIQGLNHSRSKTIGVSIELKQPARHKKQGFDLSQAVLTVISEFGYKTNKDNIFVQCFDEDEIKRLRTEFQCRLPLIQMYGKRPSQQTLNDISKFADGIGIPVERLIEPTATGGIQVNDFVQKAHNVVLQVHAGTFQADQLPPWAATADELLHLLFHDARIDGLISSHPDIVIKYLEKTERREIERGPFHLLNGNGNGNGK